MKVLVYIDHKNGAFKKAAGEAIHYASKISNDVTVLALGSADENKLTVLGNFGASKVLLDTNAVFTDLDSQLYTKAIVQAAEQIQADVIVFSNNNTAKAVAPRVAAKLNAGMVSNALSYPDTSNGFVIKKSVFSGKAFAFININTAKKVIAISPNSNPVQITDALATVETFSATNTERKITIKEVTTASGKIPLPEAELVVSGGRGLKGPENWGIVEDLATAIGAELACSRPVADSHWRPHNEHVGQTGGTIKPNLYIAIGISGAIQHLAGVNASKTIVVINKDPEAPFFKAADYGVCADAFEVLPKFTEAVKKFKANQA
jgi:electron transfer flavoprotein alpha subunit